MCKISTLVVVYLFSFSCVVLSLSLSIFLPLYLSLSRTKSFLRWNSKKILRFLLWCRRLIVLIPGFLLSYSRFLLLLCILYIIDIGIPTVSTLYSTGVPSLDTGSCDELMTVKQYSRNKSLRKKTPLGDLFPSNTFEDPGGACLCASKRSSLTVRSIRRGKAVFVCVCVCVCFHCVLRTDPSVCRAWYASAHHMPTTRENHSANAYRDAAPTRKAVMTPAGYAK